MIRRLSAQIEKTVARPVFAIQSTVFSGLQIVGTNREDCSLASLCYSVYRFLRVLRLLAQTEKIVVWPAFAYSLYKFPRIHRLLAQTEITEVQQDFAVNCTDTSGSTDCRHRKRHSLKSFLGVHRLLAQTDKTIVWRRAA